MFFLKALQTNDNKCTQDQKASKVLYIKFVLFTLVTIFKHEDFLCPVPTVVFTNDDLPGINTLHTVDNLNNYQSLARTLPNRNGKGLLNKHSLH